MLMICKKGEEKMTNTMFRILFIEDNPVLLKDQTAYFRYNLAWFRKHKDDEAFFSTIEAVSKNENNSFSLQMKIKGEQVSIRFENIEIEIHDEYGFQQAKDKLITKYRDEMTSTLFVVDLCLNHTNQDRLNDPTDALRLIKALNNNAHVLKMSALIAKEEYLQGESFIVRAVKPNDKMHDTYPASMPSLFLNYLKKNYSDDKDPCFELLSYLLRSGYFNRQYLGGILTKLIIDVIVPEMENK